MSKDDRVLEELRRIRELLEPKPAPPTPPPPKGLWKEFMDFLSKYKIMGLAVAFIMAVYLGLLVQALVTDFILPIIGIATGGVNFADAYYQIPNTNQKFLYGQFLGALITFIIVAVVIFLIVKITKRWGIE
jgi:large conductance mechanosensitive channel